MSWASVLEFLEDNPDSYYSANSIILKTGMSRRAVYKALKKLKVTSFVVTHYSVEDNAVKNRTLYKVNKFKTIEEVINNVQTG